MSRQKRIKELERKIVYKMGHDTPLSIDTDTDHKKMLEEYKDLVKKEFLFDQELPNAQKYFHLLAHYQFIESEMEDWLIECFDLIKETEDGDYWICEDFRFDHYDSSFELLNVDDEWEPTEEQLKKAWEFGFSRCWICYKDGGERYYSVGGRYEKGREKTYR